MGRLKDMRSALGMEEVQSTGKLAKALVAEFLGTAYIVLVGCGACRSGFGSEHPSLVQIALAFGLTVATAVLCFGSASGAHLNPAVTCAFLVTGKCSLLKSVLYIAVQCVGAIAGAGLLRALSSESQKGSLGNTAVSSDLTAAQAFGIEAVITFLLVLTVFAATDENRLDIQPSYVPLAVGLVVTGCHLFAVNYTGSSMNTARSFGPAVVTANWEHHWVYWVGPIVGGVIAGLLYQHVFMAPLPEAEAIERLKLQALLRIREKEVIVDKTTCF